MNARKIDLEVDFIGGQGSLTKEEEQALSDYFKQRRTTSTKSENNNTRKIEKRTKTHA